MSKIFKLSPVAKDYLWGGNRLNEIYEKNIMTTPVAETWECSTHNDGRCVVATGLFSGETLYDVLRMHPEYLGTHPLAVADKNPVLWEENAGLPILVKFIDAKADLSVQVHPDDEYAKKNELGQLGKTEMWYILDASRDAELIYGLNRKLEKEEFRRAIEDGGLEKYLQRIPVKKNDVFFIRPGTIHAIGAGTMLVEIQQNSNLTYRLFDYNRKERDGSLRPLHIDKALDVSILDYIEKPRQPLRKMSYVPGCAKELIGICEYFEVERWLVNTERVHRFMEVKSTEESFEVLLCVEGCGTIFDGENRSIPIFKGDCIFVPANSDQFYLHGKMQVLKIRC